MLIVLKSGSLSLLEHSGPVQACNGIALTFVFQSGHLSPVGTDPMCSRMENVRAAGAKCRIQRREINIFTCLGGNYKAFNKLELRGLLLKPKEIRCLLWMYVVLVSILENVWKLDRLLGIIMELPTASFLNWKKFIPVFLMLYDAGQEERWYLISKHVVKALTGGADTIRYDTQLCVAGRIEWTQISIPRNVRYDHTESHCAVDLTWGPQHLPERVLHTLRSSASSINIIIYCNNY